MPKSEGFQRPSIRPGGRLLVTLKSPISAGFSLHPLLLLCHKRISLGGSTEKPAEIGNFNVTNSPPPGRKEGC